MNRVQLSDRLRQLSHLCGRGQSLPEAIEACAVGDPTLQSWSTALSRGDTLAAVLRAQQAPAPVVSLVEAGESQDRLAWALESAAAGLDQEEQLQRSLVGAILYPTLLFALAAFCVLVVLRTVQLSFVPLFEGFSLMLPLPTRSLLWLAGAMPVLTLLAGLGVGVCLLGIRSQALQLTLPYLGDHLRVGSAIVWLRWLSLSCQAGLSTAQGAQLAAEACPPGPLREAYRQVAQAVEKGDTLSVAVSKATGLSAKLRWLVEKSEEGGLKPNSLRRAADFLGRERDLSNRSGLARLEPILLTVVALCLGWIILSLFLPLYQLIGNLG